MAITFLIQIVDLIPTSIDFSMFIDSVQLSARMGFDFAEESSIFACSSILYNSLQECAPILPNH
jgi:hypothetical protein